MGATIWFTELSGAGKTTVSTEVANILRQRGLRVEVLDGDIVRQNFTRDLGFSRADTDDNIRQIGFVAHLLTRNGVVVLVSAISPYCDVRQESRQKIGINFMEVYVNAPLATCEEREVKDLYKRARQGEIKFFTGIDDPCEPPLKAEVKCLTDREDIEQSVAKVIEQFDILRINAAVSSTSFIK